MSKELLTQYIDAVITNDTETQKVLFSQYAETKTKEVLGFKYVEPQGEPTTVVGLSAPVTESILTAITEAQLSDEIDLEGNTVLVRGKPVGRLEERKHSEDDIDGDLYFVSLNGDISQIKNNDIVDLVKVIQHKYLDNKV